MRTLINMRIQLKYFTGTGNSLRILDTCREVFENLSHEVELSEINLENNILEESDIIGFCFPVYAFDIPRICRKYLKRIKKFNKTQKVFILITAGNSDESGFSIKNASNILEKKNCNILYSYVVEMPPNWTTAMNPPNQEECLPIINKGVAQAKKIAQDILNEVHSKHEFNIPLKYGKIGLYKEYMLFRYLGIYNLWRSFKTYDSCNGCQLCATTCPTRSIEIVNKRPKWKSTCEQCMRCVNICPNESIYQSFGGDTKGKNRYIEPSYKPIRKH